MCDVIPVGTVKRCSPAPGTVKHVRNSHIDTPINRCQFQSDDPQGWSCPVSQNCIIQFHPIPCHGSRHNPISNGQILTILHNSGIHHRKPSLIIHRDIQRRPNRESRNRLLSTGLGEIGPCCIFLLIVKLGDHSQCGTG